MIKINFNRSELLNAVNKAALALPNKSTMPILEHLLFNTKEDKVTITSCDQEHMISADCNVISILGEGDDFCIKGKMLQTILKLITSEEVEFTVANNKVDISSVTGKYTLPCLSADEYLDTSYFAGDPVFLCRLEPQQINEIMRRTGFAYSNDDFRPSMTGYNFRFTNGNLQVATTDSFKLGLTNLSVDCEQDFQEIILMPKTVSIISKLSTQGKLFVQQINARNTYVMFETPDCTLSARIISEKFPPYESVIPTTFDCRFTIDRIDLMKSIERIQNFTDQVTNQINLTISYNSLALSGADENTGSSADENLECHTSSDALLRFKSQYLIDCLNAFGNSMHNDVTFNWNTNSKPVVIKQLEDENHLTLLMPIKV